MARTLEETLVGADFEGGELFCDELYNNLKNHWRANYGGEPCGSAGLEYLQPGMIISDEYDDRLYHVILASGCACSEIVQTCVPVPDDVPVYFGYEFDGAIYYDELTNNEFVIEAKNAANVEGVTVNLLETNQRFRVRQNADIMSMYLDGTDAWLRWSDGDLILMTDEGVNNNTIINIQGKGTGYGLIEVYDQDSGEYLRIAAVSGRGYMGTYGANPGSLRFQADTPQDIQFWNAILAGNPDFSLYGWITAGAAVRYGRISMDDTNDEFEIEAENNANHEGITILIQEANQKFRVRGAARALKFYVKSDGEIGTNQAVAAGHSGGYTPGTISHRLPLYDENQALVGYIALYDALT